MRTARVLEPSRPTLAGLREVDENVDYHYSAMRRHRLLYAFRNNQSRAQYGFVCRLNIVPLDRDNGTFNSSNTLDRDNGTFNSINTDVVEKVNFVWLLQNTGVHRWRKDPHSM